MNLMSCHGFLKDINYVVILKCPKRMLEYYFLKGFSVLERNDNNLAKLLNEVLQRINAEETDHSDKVTTCINTISSTSNTLKNLLLNKSLHYFHIKTYFNDKEDVIINIFSLYVEPLLTDINHPAFL